MEKWGFERDINVFHFFISASLVLQLSVTESKSTVGMNKYEFMNYVLAQKVHCLLSVHLLKVLYITYFVQKNCEI